MLLKNSQKIEKNQLATFVPTSIYFFVKIGPQNAFFDHFWGIFGVFLEGVLRLVTPLINI